MLRGGKWRPGVLAVLLLILGALLGIGAATSASSKEPSAGEDSRLQAIQAIDDTMYTYAYQLDTGTLDALMATFADDAFAEYSFPGGHPVLHGKQEIRNFLGGFAGTGGQHMITDPLVKVDGSRASGLFYLWRVQPTSVDCSQPKLTDVGWLMGRYDTAFSNVHGRWLIQRLVFVTQEQGTLPGCHFANLTAPPI